jgi:hypothetical protein
MTFISPQQQKRDEKSLSTFLVLLDIAVLIVFFFAVRM